MQMLPAVITPDCWIIQLLSARAVAEGGIVRRSGADVERLVGRQRFLHEVPRRGFRAIENAGQIVVFCNTDDVSILLRRRKKTKFLRRNLQKFSKTFGQG